MRVLLVNPNTSADMTERAVREAQDHATDGSEIVGVTAEFGCAVIASRASYAIAAHAALDAYARHGTGIDAVVLCCFGDPGLEALREVAPVPVIGLADAAVTEAAQQDAPFAIVTAGPAWVPMLEERVAASGHARHFRGVVALDTTGLALSRDPVRFAGRLNDALEDAVDLGAQSIVLGGAAFAGVRPAPPAHVRLIDPIHAAMRAVEQSRLQRVPTPCTLQSSSRGLSPALAELLARGKAA
jgi:Asp/Glu/hydantoin racemase